MPKTKPAVPPTFKPSSLEDLKRLSQPVGAEGPSGAKYLIRQLRSVDRAKAGDLPTDLRRVAYQAATAAAADGRDPLGPMMNAIGPDRIEQFEQEKHATNDRLVLAVVVEPDLQGDASLLPPNDYDWLLQVANGEEDSDNTGRLLFGPQPRYRIEAFAEAHDCKPDCPGCAKYAEMIRPLLVAAGQ